MHTKLKLIYRLSICMPYVLNYKLIFLFCYSAMTCYSFNIIINFSIKLKCFVDTIDTFAYKQK